LDDEDAEAAATVGATAGAVDAGGGVTSLFLSATDEEGHGRFDGGKDRGVPSSDSSRLRFRVVVVAITVAEDVIFAQANRIFQSWLSTTCQKDEI